MSQIGYYRYKLESLTKGIRNVPISVNNVLYVTHKVEVLPMCGDWVQLKWIDKNGQFRFFPFLELFSIKDAPKSIGETSNIIESLRYSQAENRQIGYNNDRSIVLRAQNVTASQRLILSDLFTSPLIYLYKGDFSEDNMDNYVIVTIKGDNLVRSEKQRAGNFEITVNLPKHYTINKL